MKKILFTAIMAMSLSTYAQVTVPQASLKSQSEQVVGLTSVAVDYTRPGVKGRSVFGEMIPYGKIWRTGANQNTTITFSDDIAINGKILPKGKYALYTVPEKNNWTVIFYKDTENWGVPQKWDDSKVVMKTQAFVKPSTSFTEYLRIDVNPLSNDKGELVISWEKTDVFLPFEVPTRDKAMQSIEEGLNEKASARDYFSAAQYLYTEGIAVDKALEMVEQSIKMSGGEAEAPFYILRQKALIQAHLGNKSGAISTAEQSIKGAKKAGNDEYVKMNEQSIAEWSK